MEKSKYTKHHHRMIKTNNNYLCRNEPNTKQESKCHDKTKIKLEKIAAQKNVQ